MPDPIRCWCWNDGITATRKTAPSIRLIRDIATTVDGERSGIEVNGYHWSRVQRAADGHPDAATDAALEAVYVARWQARNDAARVGVESRATGLAMREIPAGKPVYLDKEGRLCAATFEPIEQPRLSALSRIWAILRGRG